VTGIQAIILSDHRPIPGSADFASWVIYRTSSLFQGNHNTSGAIWPIVRGYERSGRSMLGPPQGNYRVYRGQFKKGRCQLASSPPDTRPMYLSSWPWRSSLSVRYISSPPQGAETISGLIRVATISGRGTSDTETVGGGGELLTVGLICIGSALEYPAVRV